MREVAQFLECVIDIGDELLEVAVDPASACGVRRGQQLELDPQVDDALLGAVVEVALDPAGARRQRRLLCAPATPPVAPGSGRCRELLGHRDQSPAGTQHGKGATHALPGVRQHWVCDCGAAWSGPLLAARVAAFPDGFDFAEAA